MIGAPSPSSPIISFISSIFSTNQHHLLPLVDFGVALMEQSTNDKDRQRNEVHQWTTNCTDGGIQCDADNNSLSAQRCFVNGLDLNLCDIEGFIGLDQPDLNMSQSAVDENCTSENNVNCSTDWNGQPVPPPTVGMVFKSWEEVDKYYWTYGKQQGFGIVRASAATVDKGPEKVKLKRNATWTCECYGRAGRKRKTNVTRTVTDSQTTDDPLVSTRKSKKCDCPVIMYASVNEDGDWEIKRVVNEHKNHVPTPRKSRFIHMYTKHELSSHVKRKLLNDIEAGIRVSQIHSSIANDRNGIQELGLSERQIRNEVQKEKRLKMKDGDANAMIQYFNKMSRDNQNFFHVYRLDEFGNIQDILWVDARSRAAYEEFGDAVCFDATYLTNKYELPFANFVGVNHHGQSILLGCALVSHETAETYEWVFSSWLSCMGKHPIGILTDQAPAMRKALKNVMPETCHRWCLWHITTKFSSKLGKYATYMDFKDELLNIIYDSLDPEEFQNRWKCFIERYDLSENEWLAGLYNERHMWVPAYVKHLFWAGMKTTQRVESVNSFFDGYVNSNTRLFEFAERYCKAMEVRANTEAKSDADSARSVRQLVLGFPVEVVFQKHYTNDKFLDVQTECTRCAWLNVKERKDIGLNLVEHVVEDRVWKRCRKTKKDYPSSERRQYRVLYNNQNGDVSCECKYFESHGIMCRHMIKVYDDENQTTVPEKYILRRWRKDVMRKHTRVKVAYHDPSKNVEVRRFDKLMVIYEPVCAKASKHEENVALVTETLQLLDIRLDEQNAMLDKKISQGCHATPSSVGNNERVPGSTPSSGIGKPSTHHQLAEANEAGLDNAPAETFGHASCKTPVLNVKDPPLKKGVGRPRKNRLVSVVEVKQKMKSSAAKNKQNATTAGPTCSKGKKANVQKEKPTTAKKRKDGVVADIDLHMTTPQPEPASYCVLDSDLPLDGAQNGQLSPLTDAELNLSVGGIHMVQGGTGIGYYTHTVRSLPNRNEIQGHGTMNFHVDGSLRQPANFFLEYACFCLAGGCLNFVWTFLP